MGLGEAVRAARVDVDEEVEIIVVAGAGILLAVVEDVLGVLDVLDVVCSLAPAGIGKYEAKSANGSAGFAEIAVGMIANGLKRGRGGGRPSLSASRPSKSLLSGSCWSRGFGPPPSSSSSSPGPSTSPVRLSACFR